MDDEQILFDQIGDWGVVTLNRPKVLNSLTLEMVTAFREQLLDWAADPSIKAILTQGAGERAFCAGGDIRFISDTGRERKDLAMAFFREEYRNNATIFHLEKPYVALIDGVVMGGGVGISVHGDYRIAGDKTLFAMPETGIGLFPDVGGGHFMPRLPDGLGLYFALTGARANAADCLTTGIATHYAPTAQQDDLKSSLLKASLGNDARSTIDAVLADYSSDTEQSEIDAMRPIIADHFQGVESVASLISSLKADSSEITSQIATSLAKQSPTSLKLTFEQMRRGKDLDFNDVMRMEFRMVSTVLDGHDLYEGVRAQIIDKDRNPKWDPADLDAVSDASLAKYFKSLGDQELVLP